jgi:hypothetical protein
MPCEGYGIFIDVGPKKPTTAHQNPHTGKRTELQVVVLIFYRGLNALSELTELENSSYDFARTCTVENLSTLGCPVFWSETVLQSCHSEPAILHAVLALGAAHHSFTSSRANPGPQPSPFAPVALSHYGKAIKHLRTGLTQSDPSRWRVILIVCSILLSFDLLQQRYPAALTHLRYGKQLLKMTYNNKAPGRDPNLVYLPPRTQSIDEQLMYNFSQIDMQATNFGGERPEFILVDSPEKNGSSEISVADTFASVDDAGRYILIFMNDCWRLIGIVPDHKKLHTANPEAVAHQRRLLTSLNQWEVAFRKSGFRPYSSDLNTDADARKLLILEINHALITINISSVLRYPDQLVFDDLIQHHSTIVDLADKLLPCLPMFNFDSAIIQPLYNVAVNCRHPIIRRKALDLLHCSGREGLWDSKLMETSGREIVRLEEERAGYQHNANLEHNMDTDLSTLIPAKARITETWMYFANEKQDRLILVHKTWRRPEWLGTQEHSPDDLDDPENWESIQHVLPVLR